MAEQKKLKILITTDLYTTNTNGVVTSVQNLFDELTQKGHDVRILTISSTIHSHKEGHVYYIQSIPLGAVYPNLRMPTSYRNKLIQEIIDWKPDIVHSQCEFFSFQFASRIARITGAPLVHTYHTLYEQYLTSYFVPSKRLGEFLAKVLSRQRLRKVTTLVAPTQKVEDALQGIEDDDQVLINLGRLGGEKNLDELLNLFAEARQENKNLKCLIVGDGPAREELERRAQKLGIGDYVIFTGMVPPSEVQNYYQLGDVFVSASTSETQGLTYIEAAANGLPLLCRQDECLNDVLQEGKNGYEYTSAEEFLDAIDHVMHDPQWRDEASKRSEEIAATFDKKSFGDAIENVYESVL